MRGRRALPAPHRWRCRLAWLAAAVTALVVIVLAARHARTQPTVVAFIRRYPGTAPLPADVPAGTPAWVGTLHFLNLFFLALVIKSGLAIRTARRPSGHWTRRGRPLLSHRRPATITLEQWLHVSLDLLWLTNGAIFVVLLFATGRWMRLVPTTWQIVPNAISVAIQYASLDWPLENGWVAYNALQMLSYFGVVFILAPLQALVGLRQSELWPKGANRLNRWFRLEWARAVHFPVMWLFIAFVVLHVTLVLTTGARRNLDHMFAAQDSDSWLGPVLCAAAALVVTAAWFALRPLVVRSAAALTGKVTR